MTKLLNNLLISSIAAVSFPAFGEEGFVPLFDGTTLEGWTCAKGEGEGDYGPFSINKEEKAHGKGKKGRFHTGDLFVLGRHLQVEVRRGKNGYDPSAPLKMGRQAPTPLGVEKPKGEWNEMEIRVDGANKATYLLNGEVVFELENFEQRKGDEFVPLKEGHIGLQAEWAEILYRNIRIKELPAK